MTCLILRYPPEEGAHIALRTVRRYMERNMDTFERVVFVVEPIDEATYKRLMPLYFPRDKKEENYSAQYLPAGTYLLTLFTIGVYIWHTAGKIQGTFQLGLQHVKVSKSPAE